MSTYVIYHRADFDGLMSAAVCHRFMPHAVLVGWDYGDPVPEIPESCEHLYIVDLSIEPLMGDPRLVWIDHHATAIEKYSTRGTGCELDNVPVGYRIDGVAACRLCWQWFTADGTTPVKETFVNREVDEPLALTLAGEYDVWDKRDPRAEQFQYGLTSFSHDPKALGALLWDDDLTLALCERGANIETYVKAENKRIVSERSYYLEFEGLSFWVLNTAKGNSLTFADSTPAKDVDALMIWRYCGDKISVSMYHLPGKEDLDLSKIAQRYGGGGHRGACRFTLAPEALPVRLA